MRTYRFRRRKTSSLQPIWCTYLYSPISPILIPVKLVSMLYLHLELTEGESPSAVTFWEDIKRIDRYVVAASQDSRNLANS